MQRLYLAYGEKTNLEKISYICPKATISQTIKLNNYRLVFKGKNEGESFLTIEPSTGKSVSAVIFKISSKEIQNIKKDSQKYHKEYVKLGVKGRKILTHVLNSDLDYNMPSNEYVSTCLEDYKCFNFDKQEIINAIANTQKAIDNNENMKAKPKTRKLIKRITK